MGPRAACPRLPPLLICLAQSREHGLARTYGAVHSLVLIGKCLSKREEA